MVPGGRGVGIWGATEPLTHPARGADLSPQAEPDPILDNYVLLVVVMSLFIGGTLVVLSGVLLLCKRCWEVHQRFNRCMPWGPPHRPARRAPHPRSPLLACPSSSGPWKKQRRPPRPTWTTAPTRYKVRGPRGPQHPAAPDCPPPPPRPAPRPPARPLGPPDGLSVCLPHQTGRSSSPTHLCFLNAQA